jgi:hypothetical protein
MKTRSTPAFAKRFLPAAALALATLLASLISASAQTTIKLYEVARFDLSATANATNSATYIGDNPLAVGWNGSKLFVAGHRGALGTTSTSNSTAIIEVTNAAGASGFVTPTYSSTFGVLDPPNGRGYTGLAMKGNQLAASFDLGSISSNGIQMFNASTNTLTWNLTATGSNSTNVGTTRGFAGPDFDPGYNGDAGLGSGLGWTTQGVGRRLLNNSTSGATIYSATANVPAGATQGGIINTYNPSSTTWRDMAFNPATGDLYMRNQFGVTRANRTSANAFVGPTFNTANQSDYIYLNAGNATQNVVGINIGFMDSVSASGSNPYSGDLLVFNDRGSTAAGQSWTNVIKFTTTSGSAVAAEYVFLSDPATSRAAYDFEWDATTQTLAVLDSTNLSVSIFATVPPVVATISASPASLGNFTTTEGTASSSQSFSVNGSGLTDLVTVTAPANFEISTNNSSFSQNLTLAQTGGNVTAAIVHVRLAATAPGGLVSGNLTLAATNATTRLVPLSGRVYTGTITTNPASLGGLITANGTASATQSFTVNGSGFTGTVTVTAPSGFEVSTDNSTFSSSVTVPRPGGTIQSVYGGNFTMATGTIWNAGNGQEFPNVYAFAAITSNGSVVTWGDDTYGGNSTSVSGNLSSNVTAVYSNQYAFAALKTNGSVVTWGLANYGGNSNSVSGNLSSNVTAVYSTNKAFAALKADGSVVTWGDASYGGNSNSVSGNLTSNVTAVYSNEYAFAALKSNGSVVVWGHPSWGGNSTSVAGSLTSNVTAVYSNGYAFAALKSNGSVVTWGDDTFGGNSTSVSGSLSSNVTTVYSTLTAFAALKSDGSVVTWGNQFYGAD